MTSVATGLAKRRRKNLYDPKAECDLGDFTGVMLSTTGVMLSTACHLVSQLKGH